MSTRRSLVLSFAQKYSEIAIRLVGTIALARLLSPAEFGVFAVASAFFVIGAAIARFGLDSYLIRARDLTPGGLGTAFGISVASHGAVAIVLGGAAILSPAWLVDETLSELILILAASLLLGPLTLLLGARLQRDMRFGMLYIIGSVQAGVSISVAIGLALAGMGPASLAASAVAEAMCMSAAALFLSSKYPLPRLGLAGWRSAVGFGITATFIDTLKRMGDSAPGLALASLSGYGAAGLFSRAQAVVALFDRGVLHGISPVILPLLASRQRGGQSLAPIYLKKVAYLSALAWPFFLFVILYADAIVRLILGDQWVEAAPIVRLFALAGLLLPLVQMNQKFYVALGLQHLYLRIQVIDQFGKIALVLLLCLIDFRLVALAFLFENALKGALTYRPLREGLGYQPSELYRALRLSAWTTLSALAIPMAIAVMPLTDNPFVDLGAAGLGAGVGWFAALILIRHPLSEEVTRAAARLMAAAPGGAALPRRRKEAG